MRVIRAPKFAQQFFDPDAEDNIGQVPDLEYLPEEMEEYLEDSFDDEEEIQPEPEDEQLDEPPAGEPDPHLEDLDYPEFPNTAEGLTWAQDNNEVVKIYYTTKKGRNLQRHIEPHGQFLARTTGNHIVLTFDKDVGDIRSFIVNNIRYYSFAGAEFEAKDLIEISRNRKNKMNNVFQDLNDVGNELETVGLKRSAAIVANSMNQLLRIKKAQYEGSQGYAIRNRRCWDNCYRQKRTTTSKSAQDIWFECHAEYLESINDNKSGWEKYAGEDDSIKTASAEDQKFDNSEAKYFKETLEKKIAEGESIGTAVYGIIEKTPHRYAQKIVDQANRLIEIADKITEKKPKLSEKIYNVALGVLKEAGWWDAYAATPSLLRSRRRDADLAYQAFKMLQDLLAQAQKANEALQGLIQKRTPWFWSAFDVEMGNLRQLVDQFKNEPANQFLMQQHPEFQEAAQKLLEAKSEYDPSYEKELGPELLPKGLAPGTGGESFASSSDLLKLAGTERSTALKNFIKVITNIFSNWKQEAEAAQQPEQQQQQQQQPQQPYEQVLQYLKDMHGRSELPGRHDLFLHTKGAKGAIGRVIKMIEEQAAQQPGTQQEFSWVENNHK